VQTGLEVEPPIDLKLTGSGDGGEIDARANLRKRCVVLSARVQYGRRLRWWEVGTVKGVEHIRRENEGLALVQMNGFPQAYVRGEKGRAREDHVADVSEISWRRWREASRIQIKACLLPVRIDGAFRTRIGASGARRRPIGSVRPSRIRCAGVARHVLSRSDGEWQSRLDHSLAGQLPIACQRSDDFVVETIDPVRRVTESEIRRIRWIEGAAASCGT